MTTVVEVDGEHRNFGLDNLSIQEQGEMEKLAKRHQIVDCESHHGECAICLNKIVLQETALVKGCEHAYCVTCILRWATYREKPTCPQCKNPFEFLNIHRSLDGRIHDYMFEESVCLLLRAAWFKNPMVVEDREEFDDEVENIYLYEDVEDDLDEDYISGSSSLRLGNRRWGDNGYVRAGRQEARPSKRPILQDFGGGSDFEPRNKEIADPRNKEIAAKGTTVGRRAKRTLKREAADKATAAKHQQHVVRLGRK